METISEPPSSPVRATGSGSTYSGMSTGPRVIISRTDNLGDVILTLPIAGYLKSLYPDLQIFFIGKKYTRPVIEQCAYIDQFLDRDEMLQNPKLLFNLQAESIIFVYPDRALARLAKEAGIRQRVGTSHRWYNWLYCNHRVNFSRIHSPLHECQLNFKLLGPFHLDREVGLDEIFPLYGLKMTGRNFVEILSADRFNLIIHPKSKGSAREWGLDHYFELIRSLPEDRFTILITGLMEEGEVIRREWPALFAQSNVTDLTGKLSLEEMIALVGHADGLLACSTGVLHIAAALGKYALGIYAPMKPIHPGRWKPVGPHAEFLVLNKICDQCRKSKDCVCIRSVTVVQVKERLMSFAEELDRTKKMVAP